MANGRRNVAIEYSDISYGKNNTMPQNAIGDKQVSEILNAIIEKRGFSRAPGFLGIKSSAVFTTYARLMDFYIKDDGTEYLLTVSNGHIYSVNKANGTITDLGAYTGSGEAYGVNALDKYFVANGTNVYKVEGTNIYMVGIAAPTGASASASGTGTLAAGTYRVYVSYARKVSGVLSLYSKPMDLGNVTVSGTQAISITCPNSSDAQVTDKIVWLLEPNSSATYFYYDNTDNTTTTFSVASDSAKNINIVMEVESLPNGLPTAFTGIVYFDGYLIGWLGNTIYWSVQSGTVYDLERFPSRNNRTFPHKIISLFSCNGSFFVNTTGGIYALPNGDLTAKAELVQKNLRFLSPRLHKEFKGVVWGLTNDGVRYFDGSNFSIDLSKDIKPDIDTITMSDNYLPCIEIFRREGKRTELHLSWRDITISTNCNNRTSILNIDSIVIESEEVYKAAWEEWEGGFNYAAIDYSGNMYRCQNRYDLGATIFTEAAANKNDRYIYNKVGTFLTDATDKIVLVEFKAKCLDIFAMHIVDGAHIIAQSSFDSKVYLGILDNSGYLHPETALKSGGTQLTLPFVFPATFGANNPNSQKVRFAPKTGKLVFIKFEQTANDNLFNVFEIVLHATLEESNLS
jgi:hypothetical protein